MSLRTDDLAGKVALVTGAGRGIGRATALALAAQGARVLAVARTEEELAALAREAPVEYLAESVGTEEGCRRIVEETRRRLGPLEVLVNNAGSDRATSAPSGSRIRPCGARRWPSTSMRLST